LVYATGMAGLLQYVSVLEFAAVLASKINTIRRRCMECMMLIMWQVSAAGNMLCSNHKAAAPLTRALGHGCILFVGMLQ
jgi:hypothetical protein